MNARNALRTYLFRAMLCSVLFVCIHVHTKKMKYRIFTQINQANPRHLLSLLHCLLFTSNNNRRIETQRMRRK